MRRGLGSIGTVLWLLLASLLFSGSVASAGEYESGFGFAISVPDMYLVLTRDEVQKNAELFLGTGEGADYEQIPAAMRREVYQRVASGQIEIFYRTEGVALNFVDNVNVMAQQAQLPGSARQLEEVCQILPGEFSRMFGRPIGLDGCEMRRVAGRRALYLAFDGAIEGTKTLQYQVEQRSGQTVILTATATNANLTRMQGEFEMMVSSIRPN